MISTHRKTARLGAALLALGLAGGTATAAQEIRPVYSPSQLRENPSTELSRHLRTLAESPRNSSALRGAGEAALALGDPHTALTFFARAEEVTPRDGRVKAGMGSCFVLLEQPAAALRFFGEAQTLGISPQVFAGDRGLAYDLTGDPKRAQADYRMALDRKEDPEVRQRLALSLAISGDREGALETIEDLVRKQDRAAWRTRAFILALTGDTDGATQATQAVMPAQAAAMRPFYAELPWLTPAQRAMAVHFGRFPDDGAGRQTAQAAAGTQYANAAATAGRPDNGQAALARRAAPRTDPVSNTPRRRPDTRAEAELGGPAEGADNRNRSVQAAAVQPRPKQPTTPPAAPARSEDEPEPSDPPPARQAIPQASAPVKTTTAPPPPSTPKKEPPKVVRLPFGPPTPGAPPKLAATNAAPPAAATEAKKEKAPPPAKAPSRHWVQIAGGANKNALPREFNRLKEKAPKLLAGKAAWTTPLRSTNRLLVGPFDSADEAQAFVNELAAADLGAFSWTSEEGQEIEKLSVQ